MIDKIRKQIEAWMPDNPEGDEYKEWQEGIQKEKHKDEILNNQKENPEEYQQFLAMKKKYEL